MSPSRPLLLAGVTNPEAAEACILSAKEASVDVEVVPNAEEAAAWLESNDPIAIALDMMADQAEAICLRIRTMLRMAHVPIIGLASELSDLTFPEMYGWGGDDVVRTSSPRELVPRLRWLVVGDSLRPPAPRGDAVIADSDRRRRTLYARVLRNAGYNVKFALHATETVTAALDDAIKLVIVDADLEPDGGVEVARRLRDSGSTTPVVIPSTPKKMGVHRAAVRELQRVGVTDSFAPPENLLFVANELGRNFRDDGRASARLLYGAVVAFRHAGRNVDSFGCTYNISAGGLYVRTLAPLDRGDEGWLELRPPRSDRLVRLEGKVAWSRRFGPIESATVPPGFGVQITDASKGDLARYEAGYRAFAADTIGS
jgi:DNA-binding response OmpR family regulator/Tfp pilus assembly protein PilZ